ncbi:MAG: GNAT family N-acetyltransferase [Pseudomonadota bacterium]|nr:GNAT family N-acetyltransferase [Pseudomonadota bacterium]
MATSPFDRVQWYALLEQTGIHPLIITAEDENGSAALPLTQTAGRITPMRNWYSFFWRQIAPEGETGDRLLAAMARHLRGRAHRITFAPVPEEDRSATRLSQAFAKAGWRVEVTRCDTNHILKVQDRSFAQYWSDRPGKLRTTLKRKAKKVEVVIHQSFDPQAWQAYENIYDASWKPTEGEPEMLRAFAKEEGAAGRLRLAIAYHEEEPIAAQFWTVEAGTAFIHKLAHLESHRKLSAGTTLTAALFERVIEQDNVQLVDFGTGNESYKSDWMEETRPRYQIDCLNMSRPAAWVDLARLALRRSRQEDVPALASRPEAG